MALLDEVRRAVRVSDGYYDTELDTLIQAALFDLQNKGVAPDFIQDKDGQYPAIVKQAVVLYAKAHFGLDNDEAPRFSEAYRLTVCSLLNSSKNVAARKRD